jgi:hypothetical protein
VVERTAHNGLVVGSNPTKPNKKYNNNNKYHMKLNIKNYKINKTKNYIKNHNLFLVINGINLKSSEWIFIEQHFKNANFLYYKIFNNAARKIFRNSIYKNNESIINGITVFIKPDKKQITKNLFLSTFNNLIFDIISLKLNNKIYNTNQLKNLYSLNYKENKLLLYQFLSTNIKFYINKNK